MSRARRKPITNPDLLAALRTTGLSYGRTAQAINTVGAESGLVLYYDASAIAHWLTGAIPQPQAVPAIVETFARLLDRADLTAHDLGWTSSEPHLPEDPWGGDPVAWLTQLGRDDMLDRRSLISAGLYSLAALNLPAMPPHPPCRPGRPRRAGASDVARIREMTNQFSLADDLFGGGHATSAVAAYLVNDVTPLLHGTTGRARPELFTATAHLAYLAGFMNADAGNAGAAQRYYIQSIRLADEADNLIMRATALRALALQAVELDHANEALGIAEAAASSLRNRSPIRTRAWMTGMLAEAHAARGDTQAALNALRQAEADIERAESTPEREWSGGYGRDALEHQTGTTLMRLADPATAERHLSDSIRCREPSQRRSRVLITARLAAAQLELKEPNTAAKTILNIKDDFPLVSSARVNRHLQDIRTRWQQFRSESNVQKADQIIRISAIKRPVKQ